MSLFGRREAPAPDDGARQALDRVVAALRECRRSGVATVLVGDVLAMLGADPENAPAPLAQFRDPQADPLTGCKPVAAE